MKYFFLFFCLAIKVPFLIGQVSFDASFHADSLAFDKLRQQTDSLFGAGNYKAAAGIAKEMLSKAAMTFGKDHPLYGNSLDNLGVMLHHAGNLPEALPYLEAGVEHARTHVGVQHEDYVGHLNNLGMLNRDMGEYGKALAALHEAVDKGKTVFGEENATYGILLNNLGLAYEDIGQLDNALKTYELALDITGKTAGKDNFRYGFRLHNIAVLYRTLKQYDKALSLFNEALPIYESKLGKDHPRYITLLANIDKTYRMAGDYEKALQIAKEAETLALQKYGRTHPEYPIFLADIGSIYFASGRLQEAREVYKEAEKIGAEISTDGRRWRWETLVFSELALVNQALGNNEEAAGYFKKIVEGFTLETQRNFDLLNQKEQEAYLKAWDERCRKLLSFSLRHPDIAQTAEDVFDMNLLMKGLTLGYRRRLLESLTSTADEPTVAAFETWKSLNKELSQQYSLTADKRVPDFQEKLQQADDMERQLAVASTSFREARQLTSWKDVQAALKEDEAAIEFCSFDYHSTKNLHADSMMYVALLLRKQDAYPQVIYLFEEKQMGNLDATRRLYALNSTDGGATLHDLVWKQLAGYLDHISTIYYSPSGQLHRINFGAIPISADQTLSQRYHLLELGSTRQLVFQGSKQEQVALKNANIYGGIHYDSFSKPHQEEILASKDRSVPANPTRSMPENLFGENNEGWAELEGTKKEVEAIKPILQKAGTEVVLREGDEASEDDFKKMSDGKTSPTIIHLATHGFFFPDRDENSNTGFGASSEPMIRCGLALAGANVVWEGNPPPVGREDGILTAYEISQLNLRNTELVVLSACDTGLGELKGNEGVYGLQRAFKIAGAHYVLMSLWNVSDRQTQEFMTVFYKEWLEKKLSIPDAFQSAQNQLKEKYSKPSNPSLWAGFVLVE